MPDGPGDSPHPDPEWTVTVVRGPDPLESFREIRTWQVGFLCNYCDRHPAIILPQCKFRHRPNGVLTLIRIEHGINCMLVT